MGPLGFLKNLVGGGKHKHDRDSTVETPMTMTTARDDDVVAEVAQKASPSEPGTKESSAPTKAVPEVTTKETMVEVANTEDAPEPVSALPDLPPLTTTGSWADFDEEETRVENPLVDEARRAEEEAAKREAEEEEARRKKKEEDEAKAKAKMEAEVKNVLQSQGIDDMLAELPSDDDEEDAEETKDDAAASIKAQAKPKAKESEKVLSKKEKARLEAEEFENALKELGLDDKIDNEASDPAKAEARRRKKAAREAREKAEAEAKARGEVQSEETAAKEKDSATVELVDPAEARAKLAKAAAAKKKKKVTGSAAVVAKAAAQSSKKKKGAKDKSKFNELAS